MDDTGAHTGIGVPTRFEGGNLKRQPCVLNEKGFALLMVIWAIIILMVIVLSFSVLARTEAQATHYFRESMSKRLMAEAGIQRAVLEIYYRQANLNRTVIPESGESLRVDGTLFDGVVGDERYSIRIINEAGRINVNTMNDRNGVILANLLVLLGAPKDTADTIVDSILDWMDKDSLHRLHGAEDEYYQSLAIPYRTKNAPLDTVEELLLVRGMTQDILFGTKEKKGLVNFITVYGNASKINLNVAPKELIMALPDATEEVAERIMACRKDAELKSLEDVRYLMGSHYAAAVPFIDIAESNGYAVESTGFSGNSRSGYTIRTTVVVQSTGTYRYASYKTPAETSR